MDIEKELRKNVRDLQEQLQRAYRRIKKLQEDLESERKKAFYNEEFSRRDKSIFPKKVVKFCRTKWGG